MNHDILNITSPYSDKELGTLPINTEQQALEKLEQAYQLFNDKSRWLSAAERAAILEKFKLLMESNKEALAQLAASEGGKPLIDSRIEVERAIQGVKVAIEWISRLTGTEIPMGLNAASMHRKAYTLREPVGVVFAVSAFNHPVNLTIHQVIPAVATGCPVLMKPARVTPLACQKVIELLYEAGLPKEWIQFLICSNETTEKIVADPRISFLTFIGSAKVGWHLRSLLAPGAHCALEHGGAAPVIVTESANLEDTIPLLVKGGFYHAGQVCVSVQRIFIQENLAEKTANTLATLARQLKVGDPLDANTEVGPLIKPQEIERIHEWVHSAVKQGAKLLCGGEKLTNHCYAPTVLYNPPLDHAVSQQEIFGPVLCIYPYKTLEKAVKLANDVPFAFQASILTEIIDDAWYAVQNLNAKTVLVNDHTAFRVDWMPFGGNKHSGLGIGGIPYTMLDMTHEKLVVWRSKML